LQHVQISFQPMFHKEYDFLAQQFHTRVPRLTLVKNMCATLANAIRYQTNPATIFVPIVNEDIIV
jgi:hypothetical protein